MECEKCYAPPKNARKNKGFSFFLNEKMNQRKKIFPKKTKEKKSKDYIPTKNLLKTNQIFRKNSILYYFKKSFETKMEVYKT